LEKIIPEANETKKPFYKGFFNTMTPRGVQLNTFEFVIRLQEVFNLKVDPTWYYSYK
jgi:hypothetical protein